MPPFLSTKVWGEKNRGFKNQKVSDVDMINPLYLTAEDAGNSRLARIATENGVPQSVVDTFVKPTVYFGGITYIVGLLFPVLPSSTIYKRYTLFRSWSYWHRFMYEGFSPLPDPDSVFDQVENSKIMPSTGLSIAAADTIHFLNFDQQFGSAATEKTAYIWRVVVGYEFVAGMKKAFRKKSLPRILFRIADGVTNWGNIIVQVLFPFMICFASMFVPWCY